MVLPAVVGRPDQRHGEEVVAFVALRNGSAVAPEELVAFAKERIGGHQSPPEARGVPDVPPTPS